MRSARMLAVGFVLGAVAVLPARPAVAQSTVGAIGPTQRVCQLTGEYDRPASVARGGWPACTPPNTCVSTGNATETEAGLRAVDLGSSFADDAGNVWILFGDTTPALVPGYWGPALGPGGGILDPWTWPPAGFTVPRVNSSDSWALAQVDAAAGLCTGLNFFKTPPPPVGGGTTTRDGKYESFTIEDGAMPASEVPLGALEVPAGGFIANGNRYVFFVTQDQFGSRMFGFNFTGRAGPCADPTPGVKVGSATVCPGGATVLARQVGASGSTFLPLYFTSLYDESGELPATPGTGTFLNIAPVVGSDLPGALQNTIDTVLTPAGMGLPSGFTTANTLFLFGSSNYARLSDVYLAVVPLDQSHLEAATLPCSILPGPVGNGGGTFCRPANWMYFAGVSSVTGAVSWSPDVHEAAQLTGGFLTAGELSVRYVVDQGSWLMLEDQFPIVSTGIVSRSAPYPWGPWTHASVAFDALAPTGNGQQLAGYGTFIHASMDNLYDPGRISIPGFTYAPYLVPAPLFSTQDAGATNSPTNVSFAMSTWNPYEVDLMEVQVGSDSDGDGIADYVDNCPYVPNYLQLDTNFPAEQQIDINTNCHIATTGFGCLLPTSPLPSTLGILGQCEEGRPPRQGDDPRYAPYWHTWYPGDACDANATTGITTSLISAGGPYIQPDDVNIHVAGNIGSADGGAPQATGTTGVAFCSCPFAESLFAFQRKQCSSAPFNCVLADDTKYPYTSAPNQWHTMTTGTGTGVFPGLVHEERSDTTVTDGGVPNQQTADWLWVLDEERYFGFPPTALTALLWTHVCNAPGGGTTCFAPGNGESLAQPNTPNGYIAANFAQPPFLQQPVLSCGEAPPPLLPLQYNSNSYLPPYGCFPFTPHGPLTPYVQTPHNTLVGLEASPAAQPLINMVESGGAQVVIGDDVAAGIPFGFTGTPALVIQTGNTHILGGLQLSDGQVGPVGAPPSVSVGPDPPTLRSYAALDGLLWGLTTLNGGVTLARQYVQTALAGQPSVVEVDVVGAVPVSAQAIVWSRSDGNFWTLDVVPGEHGASAVRFVRIDILGGAVEAWRLRESEEVPDAFFLSASAEAEVLLALSIHGHSEVVLLDGHGQAHWSAKMDGALLSTPIATTAGIGMPMSRPATSEHTNLDVRFIERRNLAHGLCGAPWLRSHAQRPGADALRGPDDQHDRDHNHDHHGNDGHDCEDER